MKPLIGVSARFATGVREQPHLQTSVRRNYLDCVARAGGSPVILPPQAEPTTLVDVLDGWLIPGGNDLDSSLFAEPLHPMATLESPERIAFERGLFEAVHPEMPIFGICMGCQFLNVMLGGSLVQHLPDVTDVVHTGGELQTYRVAPGSLLSRILPSENPTGRSYHHQACARLGEGLVASAWHQDGTIEGLEATNGRPLFAVQWHPERTKDSEDTLELFAAFVRMCYEYAVRRRG